MSDYTITVSDGATSYALTVGGPGGSYRFLFNGAAIASDGSAPISLNFSTTATGAGIVAGVLTIPVGGDSISFDDLTVTGPDGTVYTGLVGPSGTSYTGLVGPSGTIYF